MPAVGLVYGRQSAALLSLKVSWNTPNPPLACPCYNMYIPEWIPYLEDSGRYTSSDGHKVHVSKQWLRFGIKVYSSGTLDRRCTLKQLQYNTEVTHCTLSIACYHSELGTLAVKLENVQLKWKLHSNKVINSIERLYKKRRESLFLSLGKSTTTECHFVKLWEL